MVALYYAGYNVGTNEFKKTGENQGTQTDSNNIDAPADSRGSWSSRSPILHSLDNSLSVCLKVLISRDGVAVNVRWQ